MRKSPSSTFLDGWRTARVSKIRHAGICIGRLQQRAIEHQVLPEEDRVRIVVRRPDLGRSIELLSDVAKRPVVSPHDRPDQRIWLLVVIGIPLGSAIGALFASFLQVDTIPWSVVSGAVCISALLVAVFARCNDSAKVRLRLAR